MQVSLSRPTQTILIAWISVILLLPAKALTVNTAADELDAPGAGGNTSLREAIRDSSSGDTIDFDAGLDGGLFFLLMDELVITENLTIDASSLADGIVLYGINDRVVRIDGCQVTIKNVMFRGGTASDGNGGGIHVSNNSVLGLYDCRIVDNEAIGINANTGLGGGIYCDSSALNLINTTVDRNFTTTILDAELAGGGIFITGGAGTSLTLIGSTIQGNSGPKRGGGIRSTGSGSVSLIDSTVRENTASSGGGIDQSSGTLSISGSTMAANVSTKSGGGIFLSGVTATLTKSTFANNASGDDGGGIAITGSSTATIESCTIAGNLATLDGGGIHHQNSTLNITNTITAANHASGSDDIHLESGSITPSGVNIVGSNDGCSTPFPTGNPNLNGDLVGSAALPLDPKLSPLGYFGGATMTMHPFTSSPAYNAGGTSSLTLDQRGFSRVVGAALDTGAVEIGLTLLVTTATDENDGALGVGGNSLRECIEATSSPGTLISFAQALDGSTITLLHGVMNISSQTLLIDASSLNNSITIDAGETSSIFTCNSSSTLSIEGLSLTRGGGVQRALMTDDDTSLSLSNCTLSNHITGALSLEKTTATISGCNFSDNSFSGITGTGGAAIQSLTSDLTIDHCLFSGNTNPVTGTPYGGAIRSTLGTLHVSRSNFVNNTVFGSLGGLGGAIYVSHISGPHLSESSIVNCTFKGNQAVIGGAIELGNIVGTITLRNLTITNNFAERGGGISVGDSGFEANLTLDHCIVASNSSPISADISYNLGGGGNHLKASGPNLIGDNSSVDSIFPTGALVGTQASPLDPLLGVHANYGGVTDTIPLLAGSPAIDAGVITTSAPPTDQRGLARSVGTAPDLGAYETGNIVGYSTWVAEKIASGLDAGFSEDSEFDTNKNGIEYATGRNPALVEANDIISLVRMPKSGGGYEMHITFAYEPNAPDLKYKVKRSTNLGSFGGARYNLTPSTGDENMPSNGTVTVTKDAINKTITVIDAGLSGDKYFWRLEVELLP